HKAPGYSAAGKPEVVVALITGGDSGIDHAETVLYAGEGAHVAIGYVDEEESDAAETIRAIEKEGRRALALPGDVSDPAWADDAVSRCVEELGGLGVVVNNAAIQKHRPIEEITTDDWERTFAVNIHGYFHVVRAALPHLARGSSIINTGSITGLEGSKELLDYSATKGAIHAFTKSLAQALLPRGIRVNCVAPGPVWTPLNPAEQDAKAIRKFGSDTGLGRPAQPEEIAPAYVFLASNADSSYITG